MYSEYLRVFLYFVKYVVKFSSKFIAAVGYLVVHFVYVVISALSYRKNAILLLAEENVN